MCHLTSCRASVALIACLVSLPAIIAPTPSVGAGSEAGRKLLLVAAPEEKQSCADQLNPYIALIKDTRTAEPNDEIVTFGVDGQQCQVSLGPVTHDEPQLARRLAREIAEQECPRQECEVDVLGLRGGGHLAAAALAEAMRTRWLRIDNFVMVLTHLYGSSHAASACRRVKRGDWCDALATAVADPGPITDRTSIESATDPAMPAQRANDIRLFHEFRFKKELGTDIPLPAWLDHYGAYLDEPGPDDENRLRYWHRSGAPSSTRKAKDIDERAVASLTTGGNLAPAEGLEANPDCIDLTTAANQTVLAELTTDVPLAPSRAGSQIGPVHIQASPQNAQLASALAALLGPRDRSYANLEDGPAADHRIPVLDALDEIFSTRHTPARWPAANGGTVRLILDDRMMIGIPSQVEAVAWSVCDAERTRRKEPRASVLIVRPRMVAAAQCSTPPSTPCEQARAKLLQLLTHELTHGLLHGSHARWEDPRPPQDMSVTQEAVATFVEGRFARPPGTVWVRPSYDKALAAHPAFRLDMAHSKSMYGNYALLQYLWNDIRTTEIDPERRVIARDDIFFDVLANAWPHGRHKNDPTADGAALEDSYNTRCEHSGLCDHSFAEIFELFWADRLNNAMRGETPGINLDGHGVSPGKRDEISITALGFGVGVARLTRANGTGVIAYRIRDRHSECTHDCVAVARHDGAVGFVLPNARTNDKTVKIDYLGCATGTTRERCTQMLHAKLR